MRRFAFWLITIVLVLFIGLVLGGVYLLSFNYEAIRAELEHQFLHQPADKALTSFGVTKADIRTIQDPPGKLKGVSFGRTIHGRKVCVLLWLRYTPELFSRDATWDFEQIRNAEVIAIEVHESSYPR